MRSSIRLLLFLFFSSFQSESTFVTVRVPDDVFADGLRRFQDWLLTNFTIDHLNLPGSTRLKHGHRLKFDDWSIGWSSCGGWVSTVGARDGLSVGLYDCEFIARTSWSYRNVQGPGVVRRGSAEFRVSNSTLTVGPIGELPHPDALQVRVVDGDPIVEIPNVLLDRCVLSAPDRFLNTSTPLPSYMTIDDPDFREVLSIKLIDHLRTALCTEFLAKADGFVKENLRVVSEPTVPINVGDGNTLEINYSFSRGPIVREGNGVILLYEASLYSIDRSTGLQSVCRSPADEFAEMPSFDASSFVNLSESAITIRVSFLDSILACVWRKYSGRKLLINDTVLPTAERGFLKISGPNQDRPCVGDMLPDLRRRFPEEDAQLAVILEQRRRPNLELEAHQGLVLYFDVLAHFHVVLSDRTEFVSTAQTEMGFNLTLILDETDGVLRLGEISGGEPIVRSIKESHLDATVEDLTSVLEVLQAAIGHDFVRSRANHLGLGLPRGRDWTFRNASIDWIEDRVIIRTPV